MDRQSILHQHAGSVQGCLKAEPDTCTAAEFARQ